MTTRLRLIALSLLLPLLLGTALPNVAVWRCAHASQIILADSQTPKVMPCRMAGAMRGMACCSPAATQGGRGASLHRLSCQPSLSQLSPFPAARLAHATRAPVDNHALGYAFLASVPSLALSLPPASMKPRGPPGDALPAFHRSPSLGLRAPPIA